jgi:phosphoglycerate kinase
MENLLRKPFIGDADPFYQRHIFVRVDYNVPFSASFSDKNEMPSRAKVDTSLETIQFLLVREAKIVLASHMGSPISKVDEALSLFPLVDYLKSIFKDIDIQFASNCIGPATEEMILNQKPKSIILLENLKYYEEEGLNDRSFAAELAKNMDVYVNEAYGACYRGTF